MTMTLKDVADMPRHEKLRVAEQARAIFKTMVGNGQQKLTPETVAALRKLDGEITIARKALGLST